MTEFDVILVGAGIAGLSAAYELCKSKKILVLEQEEQPGYHSTGRSAAVYAASYGSENTAIYALVRASWDFFKSPPEGFTEYPLHHDRGIMFIAGKDHMDGLRQYYDEMKIRNPDAEWVGRGFIKSRFPPLDDNYTAAAIYEPTVYDLDVSALQEGYLRAIRQAGGVIQTGFRATDIHKTNDLWIVSNGQEQYGAPCLVNAAGAWVDEVATMASVRKIGIQPLRRSAILVEGPGGEVSRDWTMVVEFREEFFFKPDAGKLMVSPANEDPSAPCDAQPEDLDIAYAADYAEKALNLSVRKVAHSWAGLRNFVEDKAPVIGFDPEAEGFFWLAGQGGYGIQTAPAAGRLAASLIFGKGVPQDMQERGLEEAFTSPARLAARKSRGSEG